jgi:hypothetical protein
MDLKDLKPKSDTVEVILVHPSNYETLFNPDGTEMSIVVHAPHSKTYKEAVHDQQNRRIQKMQKGKKTSTFSAEDLENDGITLLAKVTKEWNITYGGSNPKLTVEKAKEVYSDMFWIREQIEASVSDSLDFTTA